MIAWYIAYSFCVLLDGGFETGFFPWGVHGGWLLSAILIAGWVIPPERYIILSLGSAVLVDILSGDTSFTITKLALAITLLTALLRRNKFQLAHRHLTYLLAFWLLLAGISGLAQTEGWQKPAVWAALSLGTAVQFMAWHWFLAKRVFLPTGRAR